MWHLILIVQYLKAMMGVNHSQMLAVASAEAWKGLAEGGIPIGAAIFDAEARLIGAGHNRRVQNGDPSMHGETDAFRNAGRQRSYRNLIMVTTLAPCWYCSGLIRQFGFGTVIVGESRNFQGGVDWLRSLGVKIVDLESEECFSLLSEYIRANPQIWNEDIGEERTDTVADRITEHDTAPRKSSNSFMARAIQLSIESIRCGGGPFGAVIVQNGNIISEGSNKVTSTNDPTAHAEILATRAACAKLGTFDLRGCEIYASCEPCPMCLGAIYWARISRIFFAGDASDAAKIGFDDSLIYSELKRPLNQRTIPTVQIMRKEALSAFRAWAAQPNKIPY